MAGAALAVPVFENLFYFYYFYFYLFIYIFFMKIMLMKCTPFSYSIASFYHMYVSVLVSVLFSRASPTKFCLNYSDVFF